MDEWTQMWIVAPNATPRQMQRIDEHIQQYGASLVAPEGLPVQSADGTWEVRVLVGSPALVRRIITGHYGLEIAREQVNN